MNHILSKHDINWIYSLVINNNIKYNYEVELRFLNINKSIYTNILKYLDNIVKSNKYDLKKVENNIYEEIKYDNNFNLIKRVYDKKEEYIIKKRIKYRYLENIPANINLSTEMIKNKSFTIDDSFIKRYKKRISFTNKNISYDLTIINDNEYNVEMEILDLKHLKKIDIIIENINLILYNIPIDNYILHKITFYKIKKNLKQPIPLKDENVINNNFLVTPKFDGLRSILYINENKNVFLIKNSFSKIENTNLICKNISNTIIDGELIDNKIFYAIDLILYNKKYENFNLKERSDILKTIKFQNEKNKTKHIYYKIKKYYPIEEINKIIKNKYSYILNKKQNTISTDGLIFNSIKENYKNSIILKWKQIITFDFKIKKIEKKGDYIIWKLYCYNNNKQDEIFPVKDYGITYISLEIDKKYSDNKIIEFLFNNEKNMFEPIKPRDDKSFPNFIDIAIDNWSCLYNKIIF